MVRLSLGEIVIILVVLVVAFGGRVQSARTEAKRSQPGRNWSPAVVTFVFVMLMGGGFFFFRAIGMLLRMMKR